MFRNEFVDSVYSLRALVKYLDDIPDEEITELNIPTGIPLVYELDQDLRPIRHYYLASDEQVAAAVDAVANQGKAKWIMRNNEHSYQVTLDEMWEQEVL